ncbi:DUF305 domain-containing protein [Helicobacter pametensis]|uniref:DUF305 domain-containing protein n=1 Tax=Helicobacter pametensis TaxID=95149 RepID=UPI000488B484|nr:DUF305 domain-containing protein [Helicobacter pametensis]
MKLKTLTLASITSLALLQAAPQHHHGSTHHAKHSTCDYKAIQKQAKSPSEAINSLMHAPMMCTPWHESKNAEIDFLTNMIPHHKGAILSSKELLKHSKNEQLIHIAKQIISSQRKEIKEFKKILKTLKADPSQNYQEFVTKAKADMDKMMKEMSAIKPTDNIDKDYMQAMIIHHQGAIDASKQILEVSKNPKIQKIAHAIIKEQEDEIQKFKALLK